MNNTNNANTNDTPNTGAMMERELDELYGGPVDTDAPDEKENPPNEDAAK